MAMVDSTLLFVGGIHGVGKSTLCDQLSQELHIHRMSASKLIGWEEIAESSGAKSVDDIEFTQKRLLLGLEKQLVKGQSYLIDGHFCLINKSHEIETIPIKTFLLMKPALVVVITGAPKAIADRLLHRDGFEYDLGFLHNMQEQEKAQAKRVARKLSVPYLEGESDDLTSLHERIQETISFP